MRQPVRLGAVVALTRMQSPQLGAFLSDMDPQVVAEAADEVFEEALRPQRHAGSMDPSANPYHGQAAAITAIPNPELRS